MSIDNQITLCSQHYQIWKERALSAENKQEAKEAMERAFFWLELQTAFITLFTVEQSKKDYETKKKLIYAKVNLSKKLADYANSILEDMKTNLVSLE